MTDVALDSELVISISQYYFLVELLPVIHNALNKRTSDAEAGLVLIWEHIGVFANAAHLRGRVCGHSGVYTEMEEASL